MSEPEILNLSAIHGYERLYQSLVARYAPPIRKHLLEQIYRWYLANIAAYNAQPAVEPVAALEQDAFYTVLRETAAHPYKTDIQLLKALTLLEWNVLDGHAFSESNQQLYDTVRDLAESFHAEHGYSYRDGITSYSLCENTLDPQHEPEAELNPTALLRKHDTGVKCIYICAPLRGDVEANIAFAREKAREVFEEGSIPVCPHLMFPPIADPRNPVEDAKAMEMCRKLICLCCEIRVYGPEWSEGMWEEIQYAERMKIPIRTDQKEVPREKNHKCPSR